jgi:membrane glycosyltransferase
MDSSDLGAPSRALDDACAPSSNGPAADSLATASRTGRSAAPPLTRGHMTPLRWHGVGAGIRRALLGRPAPAYERAFSPMSLPWERAARRRRLALLALVVLSAAGAGWLAGTMDSDAVRETTPAGWRALRLSLFTLLMAWVAAGFYTALMGLLAHLRGDPHALKLDDLDQVPLRPEARTAIIMPICNEDVDAVFAGLRATCESLLRTGHGDFFDVYILSDSNQPGLCAAELAAHAQFRALFAGRLNVHYRRRRRRTHRKAGNVADFCRRWGRGYAYMIVLDADSVMSGETLVSLARLMEREPRAGIIQTAPQGFGLDTLHARMQQFSSSVIGRLFTLGMRYWQLGESHYWGHNAIIRVAPFMRHCSLPTLPGNGSLSGAILSHDFVEAALMRRAGYEVWLVPELQGSYEQHPPNLIEELRRDRRWCQGNLMNVRLIAEPGLKGVHRAMLGTAAFSYASAPLWAAFLLTGFVLLLAGANTPATTPGIAHGSHPALWGLTAVVLFAPRLMALALILFERDAARYGGRLVLARGLVLEAAWSAVVAPVRMAAHSVFVLGALTGLKLEWRSPPREAVETGWTEAVLRFAPYGLLAAIALLAAAQKAPHHLVWMLPVGAALMLGPVLAVWGSRERAGIALRSQRLACTPEELDTPPVLRMAQHYSHLTRNPASAPPEPGALAQPAPVNP